MKTLIFLFFGRKTFCCQLSIVPILPIEMDHPNSSWKDEETWNLKKEKFRYLDRDIRFKGLGDAEDHRRCFEWEYVRTRHFLGHKFEVNHVHQIYPFYIKSFPKNAYKSHTPKQRTTWEDLRLLRI